MVCMSAIRLVAGLLAHPARSDEADKQRLADIHSSHEDAAPKPALA